MRRMTRSAYADIAAATGLPVTAAWREIKVAWDATLTLDAATIDELEFWRGVVPTHGGSIIARQVVVPTVAQLGLPPIHMLFTHVYTHTYVHFPVCVYCTAYPGGSPIEEFLYTYSCILYIKSQLKATSRNAGGPTHAHGWRLLSAGTTIVHLLISSTK